ncbi:hypothetical protein RZO07_14705 [Pseudomonas protegens]|uniref:hypothetical protein n=1 Tax=Pseudomonas protegens TaxID=380021 RepID=UPI002936E48E|nr:hypothetical protein [Pseudomonas protegens]WOE82414.1 hypothetical protein RZO07_14705 [Pseudomonas protegens]
MTDIVLLKDGDNVLSANADVEKFPYTTDTLWSKLDSLVTRLALLPERPALTGGWDKTVKIEAITLALGGARQAFPLSTPFVVPGLLFSFKEGKPEGLLTPSEINNDIDEIANAVQAKGQTAADEAVAHARECRALATQALKQELRRREFAWGDGGFLKIEGVGTAVTSVQLALTIDGAALLGEPNKANETVEVLRASLRFSAAASLAGGISAAVDARLELVITADPSFASATAEFLSSFDLPQLPNIPRPRLRFPKVALPSLSLVGMNWPDINAQFLDFDLKLPGFGAAPVKVVWTTPPGLHITRLSPLQIAIGPGQGKLLSDVGGELATLTGIALDYDGATGQFTVAGAVGNMTGPIERKLADVKGFDLDGRLPFTIDILDAKTTVSTGAGFELARPDSTLNANAQAKLTLGRIVVRSKEDPRLFIAFAAELDASAAAAVGGNPAVGARLTSLKVIEPYPLELVCAAGTAAFEGLVRLVAMIKLPRTTAPDVPGLPVPDLSNLARVVDRLSDLLVSALKWMARQVGEAGAVLSQLAQAGIEALARLIQMLRDAADNVLSHVVIEVRLDAETYQLRQILISPVSLGQGVTSGLFETKAYGVELTVPRDWQPSLLIDVSGPLFAALLVEPSSNKLKIASDLWLDRDGAPPQSAADTDKDGKRPDKRLITLSAEKKTDRTLALIAVDGGRVNYLQVFASDGGHGSEPLAVPDIPNPGIPGLQWPPQIPVVRERPALRAIDFENDVVGGVDIDWTSAERLLPFFDAPGTHSSGSDKFGQYVEVTGVGNPKLVGSSVTVPLGIKLKVGDFETTAELKLTLDLSTLCARITGGDSFVIRGKRKPGTMFGLEYVILPRKGVQVDNDDHFNQFQLDLSGGNPRMALHPDAEVKLFYRRLGGEGRGLSLRVDDFAIAKSGFDLIASVDPDEPVTLPGVDMPFRFSDGRLVVKNGRLLAFSITGVGQLPPELVGEASCTVKIMLGPDAAGDLAVLSCDAELDKTDDPIVCQATRFTLTIAKLGFAVQDFGAEGGYQFYFLVTGTLVFTPPGDEFGKTFLKYLRGAKLTLNKAPLSRDMRLLARSIEIQVPLDPKVNFNLFEIFAFEVRGFGFHPASPAFDGSPAMNISGQVKFREVGDAISAKIDCHSLWIAPPKPRTALPRVRFDGLTVALSLNGAGSIEGTALTVDENLSELERPFPLPKGVTASGFLASGQLKLSGWAPMTASMGFLELKKEKDHRHAFFLYGQMEKLSVPIPTPIKELYLREVGFGFGYRYTLAGLAQADQVTTPRELIRVLDDVSRYQGDLPKFSAWQPEMEGDRITLAMRALATVDSPYKSSEEVRLEEKKLQASGGKSREEGFPNALLFDMAAALRSDLTLLVTARAWFSVNYDTWMKKKDEISTKPPLRGYLYLSAPRKELLARLVSDPEGYIGDTPKLPEEVLEAFKSVHFASTLYIRPGLFHFEFGWPYELKLEVPRKPNKNFGLKAEGGLVFRVEDFSLLYGIALRARGFAEFGGSVGGSSLGASALARADFSLDAKFIAYLSLERASDTLFYGCLAFSCNLSFEIKFWVEIDIGFDSIRLSASYSQSFAISAAVEVAIGPNVLAGRAAVAISVGAFGRSLTLSVGFGFNEGDLVETRRKVERFLALGLTAAVPDPAASLAPPPTAMPAGTDALDERAKEAATLGQIDKAVKEVPEQPYEIDIASQFTDRTFTPNTPLFWAMLFEVPANPGTYVLQLVPRDSTQAFIDMQGEDIDLATVDSTRSTFYGPASTKFRLSGEAASTLRQLKADQGDGLEIDVDPTLPIGPDVDAEVAISGGKVLTLGDVLSEAFLTDKVTYDPTKKRITLRKGDVLDIVPETIRIDRPKARTRAEAEAELAAAADVSAKLSVARALVRGIEEKRSALISAICSSAEQIAREARLEGSHLLWPARPAPTPDGVIDARDFGLTFVIRENAGSAGVGATLSQLFDLSEEKLPPKAVKLGIQLVDKSGSPFNDNDEQPIRLFNPPSRFFDRTNPCLACFTSVHDARGVVLDWDLEPAWEASANIWHDPEYHLKTYRVQRVFKENGRPTTKLKPMETTTKAAAPLKPVVEGAAVQWQRITPPVQFVDDFADLPEDLRPALLRTDSVDPDIQQKAVIAWGMLLDRLKITGKVELVYTVQAIDIAGHEGLPVPFEIEIDPPKAAVPRVAQAELIVAYDTLPEVAKAASATLALRLDDRLDARPEDRERPQRLAQDGTGYVLRIRREASTPLGIYGVDAVTQALKRPTPDQFENKLTDDVDIELTLAWGSDAPKAGEEKKAAFTRAHALDEINLVEGTEMLPSFKVARGQLKVLKEALGIDPVDNRLEPRSVRVAIQRARTGAFDASTWLVVDLRLRIGELGSDSLGTPRPRPVDTVVETFESPKVVGFAPLAFEDLAGEAGRLLIDYPARDSTLDKLLAGPEGALQRLRDGDRRVATRVRWNVLPSKEAGPPKLIGGYDVFEADLTASLTRKDVIGVAEPIARVAALDPLTASGEPSTLEDYGAIEAFYPSETLRLSTRKGAARRRAWFSPAESLGVWPEVGIRRSVGLTVADAEIAQLFTRGQPTSVLVRFEGANSNPPTLSAAVLLCVSAKVHGEIARASGNMEPQAPCLPRLTAALTGGGTKQPPSPETVFENSDTTPLSYTQLRRLLHALVIDGSNAEDWWNDPLRDSFAEHRTTLHGLSIEIEARYADVSLGTITQKVDLDTALHPVLADVLDAVRWHIDDDEQSFYRRYEPVIDPAPPTDATTIGQFLDQRPIERDPYGWAILRTLGLAAGLRLSDTLSGDFVPPGRAISLVRDAFATVLPRYRHGERELLQPGQPFVDLMTRAGGLYTVASFDGGDTTPDKNTRRDILDNELVSLMQIALRPLAEAQVGQASSGARYYAVSLKEKLATDSAFEFQIHMERLDGVIDLQFLDSGLSRSSVATFADTSSQDGKKADLIERISRGRTTEVKRKFTIPASVMKSGTPFALARVTWPGSEETDWTAVLDAATDKLYAFREITSPRVLESGGTSAEECLEAFERFPELPPTAITQLLSAQGSDARALFKRFLTLATARFGADGVPKPDATADLDAFFVRWPDLMRRFFSHGPSASGEAGTLEVPFSLALMPRPMPLRSKVQEDGTMEMVVVHKDRLARRRRYFVRPFGRYDNIVAAWHAEHTDAFPWVGKRSLADSCPDSASAQPSLPAIKLADMDHYSLDITVPRSEPLAPPVVLSAQRLDVGEGTQQRPGRLIEFVVSRHQEEVASESNINVADSLQFEHLAFGFYREFRDIAWAQKLRTLAEWSTDALDLLPGVKNENAFEPKPLSFKESISLDEVAEDLGLRKPLPERLPDGWRGITALRTEDVPHFYRVHVVAFAAAGVVVSEPVVATVAEGKFTLTWPWKDEPNYKLAPPTWSVTQSNDEVCVTLESPLVRYFDGMPDEQKAWSNSLTREQRRVYALPDPGVAYEIATVGAGGDSATEVALTARRDEQASATVEKAGDSATEVALTAPADEQSAFFMAWTGTRFEAKASAAAKLLPPAHDDSNGWRLKLPLERRTEPPPPQSASPTPEQRLQKAIAPVLGFAGCFEMANDDDWAAFAPFAPRTDSRITLTRPAVTLFPPDFNDAGFRQLGHDAEAIRARLQAIKSTEGASDVLGTRWNNALGTLARLAEFRNLPGSAAWLSWQALFGGDQPRYAIDLPRFAGVPNWPASTTYIQMPGLSYAVWKMDHPNDVSFARRAPALVALRRATAIPNDEAGKQNRTAFQRALFAAIWWEDRCDVLLSNEQGLGAYPMVTALFPEALRDPAQDYVALFTNPAAPLQASPGLEFLARLDVQLPAEILDDSRMRDALTALLEHLATHELYPSLPGIGFGAALEALQGVENGEATRADLLLPSVGLDKVVALINAIPGVTPVEAEKPIALTLRRPTTDAEVGHVKAMGGSDLQRFVDRLATDQIFGAGREPRLKATKGFLDALYHVITRKED